MTRYLAILLLLIPAATYAQGIGGIATRAFGAREWREAVATVGALPTCDTGSGVASENGVVRYVVAEQALYRCSGGAWSVALAGGGSGDITAVGDCATGACFSSVTARHAFLGPVGGGTATFRALVEADISDLSHAPGASDFGALALTGDVTSTGLTTTLAADVVAPAEMADADHGDVSWSAGVATVDSGAVGITELADDGACSGLDLVRRNSGDTGFECAAPSGGSSAFSDLTSGTNTTAAMVVGSDATLKLSGSGSIFANGLDADADGTADFTLNVGAAPQLRSVSTNGPAMLNTSASSGMATLRPNQQVNDGMGLNGGGRPVIVASGQSGFEVTTTIIHIPPEVNAPATCSIGDVYVDSTGAYCACTSTNTWENLTATGACT